MSGITISAQDDAFNLKICDFGLAKIASPGDLLKSCSGTQHYMAPEVHIGGYAGAPVDIWAAGVLLFVMLARCVAARVRLTSPGGRDATAARPGGCRFTPTRPRLRLRLT